MLTAKDIAERIQNPSIIQKEDIAFLGDLAQKNQYTQIYSILYLKGLGDTKDIHFEEELQKHSYRIGDRSQLFKLVHDFSDTTSTISEESTKLETGEFEKEKIIQEDIEVVKTELEPVKTLNQDEIENTAETFDIEDGSSSNLIAEEISINEENSEKVTDEEFAIRPTVEETKPVVGIPSDTLEEAILHHSFAANYQLPELSDDEIEALENRKIIEPNSTEPEIDQTQLKEIEIDTKLSFTSWLHSNKNNVENLDEDKLKIDAVVNDSNLTFEINEFFGEVVKPKKEFFSPIKKAKESLSEEALPVSETLAKIYALQGNFPKAIYAYEQLSLKYPEKKIFFAIQIKDLQKKLNT